MITTEQLIGKFREALEEKWGYIWGTSGVMWTAARQAALEKTTDANREQGRKYGKKWIGHKVADCSGLFVWAFKAYGGSIYHGSNTMYNKYCSSHGTLSKGQRTDGRQLLPGTAVFVWNDKKKNYSHVGLYIGGGTVIEAAGTKEGVITSAVTASKWSHWGELNGVNYIPGGKDPDPAPVPDPEPAGKPTIRKGDRGEYVTLAQTMLLNRGYRLPKYGADGSFGAETQAAVRLFQQDWGLTVDGVIGPKTWQMLESTPSKAKTYRVTITGLDKTQAQAMLNNYPGATMAEEE